MKNDSPAIAVSGLAVRRGRNQVLEGLDVAVPHGAVVGLLGPSGCGKTTLMRSIVGAQLVHGGTVTVLGEPAGSAGLRRRVGYMTQSASIYDDLTVRQNLRYFARILGTYADDVERVIDLTDLGDCADRLAAVLSGGERSRLSLGVALLGSPELLVLDEPTVGLDPVLRADLWALFRRLAAEGTTLLVSSHVMDEATRCDRLLLMRGGEIIADDTPAGLLRSTGTATAEDAFLAIIAGHDGGPRLPHHADAQIPHAPAGARGTAEAAGSSAPAEGDTAAGRGGTAGSPKPGHGRHRLPADPDREERTAP